LFSLLAEISNALSNVLAKSTKATAALKTKLDSLNKENETFEAKNPNSAQTKIRRNTHAAIARKFRDTLKDLQLAQTEYKKELREKFTRQIELGIFFKLLQIDILLSFLQLFLKALNRRSQN
jgi:DNA repair ATPase RecN